MKDSMSTMESPFSLRSASSLPEENSTLRLTFTGAQNHSKILSLPSSCRSMSPAPESAPPAQFPPVDMEDQISLASSPYSSRAVSPTLVDDAELHTRRNSIEPKSGEERSGFILVQAAAIERLQDELDHFKEQYRAEKQICQTKKEEIYRLTSDSNKQTKKFEALEADVTKFKRIVKDRDFRIAELLEVIRLQADDTDHSDQTISELQSALGISQREVDQMKRELEAIAAKGLEMDTSNQKKTNEGLLEKVEELELALVNSQLRHDELQGQLEVQGVENMDLRQQFLDSRRREKHAETEIDRLQDEVESLHKQLEHLRVSTSESAEADKKKRQQLLDNNILLVEQICQRDELVKGFHQTANVQGPYELAVSSIQSISQEPHYPALTGYDSSTDMNAQADPYFQTSSTHSEVDSRVNLQNASILITIKAEDRKNWSLLQRITRVIPESTKLNIKGPEDLVDELIEGMKAVEQIYTEQIDTAAYWEGESRELEERLNDEIKRPRCTLSHHRSLGDELEAIKMKVELQEQLLTAWGGQDVAP